MLRDKKGFTLIEIVMVIVLLGILAAVAIPRFIDLGEDARQSTARGVAGAIMGATTMLHAQYLLDNTATYTLGSADAPCVSNGEILCDAGISGDLKVTAASIIMTDAEANSDVTITIPSAGTNEYIFNVVLNSTNGPRMTFGTGF